MRQEFRDHSGQRVLTRHLDEVGSWQPVPGPAENPALEAAMRPFLADLTAKELEAVIVYFSDERPSLKAAAKKIGISDMALMERLHGSTRYDTQGALGKIKESLLEALDTELRFRLAMDEDGAYADLRRWLTPSHDIRADGTEDPWVEARCGVCNRLCAHWRPNSIRSGLPQFSEPELVCMIHGMREIA